MIDIHTHLIANVDDGSKDVLKSAELVKEARQMGVTDIICTPHHTKSYFTTSKQEIIENFNLLKDACKDVDVNLYLGQEIFYDRRLDINYIKENTFTLADSNYILFEFDCVKETDISEVCYELKLKGYIPIVAHVERYTYLSYEDIEDIASTGALIQVNASSICEGVFGRYRKIVTQLLNNKLVSFVASDIHTYRKYEIDKAFEFVKKKYGEEYALEIFQTNAEKIINKTKQQWKITAVFIVFTYYFLIDTVFSEKR